MNDLECPPLTEQEYLRDLAEARRLRGWVRAGLFGLVLVPTAVFVVAVILDPYQDGKVWLQETHRQLGLPECTFLKVTNLPCPACGMTSSFALFVRGDLVNSVRANVAGTLLAVMSLLFIVWGGVSVMRGRMVGRLNWESMLVCCVLTFVSVMLVRWGIVLAIRLGT